MQRLPAQRDGRTEARLRQLQPRADHDARKKMTVDGQLRQMRPQIAGRNPVIGTGHGAAEALERADEARQIIALHADVAVGQHDDVVRDARAHVDEVCDLRIGAHDARYRRRARCALPGYAARSRSTTAIAGSFGFSTPNTIWTGAGIILLAERDQIFEQPGFVAVQRLEDRHGRRRSIQRPAPAAPATSISAAAMIMNRQPNAPASPKRDQQNVVDHGRSGPFILIVGRRRAGCENASPPWPARPPGPARR